ncbi:MAG: hypothetical protein PUB19_08890 [Lachnospiraceae bacterium]|nr:hypothetical protein [Lachnospiraceae bacterium]
MDKLKISDIYFGKIDGYNEFLEYGEDACKGLFFEFPNIQINKLLNGSTYYIFGNKGTGKTMLLKYLESKAQETPDTTFTEFLRFKREIDAEQRNQIKRASTPTKSYEEVIEKDIPTDSTLDCTLAWEVFLIKTIVSRTKETDQGIFKRNDKNWTQLCKLIKALYGDDNIVHSERILPKMKRGNVELNVADIAKTYLEFEWVDKEKRIVPFSSVAKQIVALYKALEPDKNKIYVFVDELELSLKKGRDYQRDVILIRDMIFAIEYLNDINRTKKFPVYVIAAIRNEVYKNIISKGMEINKSVLDFGVAISWEQKGGDIRQHPLLKMIEKRIHFSEEQHGIPKSKNIWETYFTQYIGESRLPIENYILDQTWYKPRDIIRLFTIIQKKYGDKYFLDQNVFQAITKQYSEESWSEFEETLTVKYSDAEVEGIKKSLTGISLPFDVQEFKNQIRRKMHFFEEVEALEKNRKPEQILKDLYEVGVIGNYGKNSRFSFKGDIDIDPLMPLTIHYPLIRFFKASIPNKRNKYKNMN